MRNLRVLLPTFLTLAAVFAFAQDATSRAPYVFKTMDGGCAISIDTSAAPELADWAEHKLAPVLAVWYPKIIALLPSAGFTAPRAYSIIVKKMDGVAYASDTNVFISEKWIQDEMNGEAIGSLVHESAHVVQRYHGNAPSWLVEGIADYVRWFRFEPESHGADMVWMRKLGARPGYACSIVVPCTDGLFSPRYDASYRISANFLNWVSLNYDLNLVTELNADLRQGKYTSDFWKQHTSKTVQELEYEWKQQIEAQLHSADAVNHAFSAQQFAPATAANAKQFVGTWRASFQGHSFLTVTLAIEANKLVGNISNADIEVNKAGELTKAEARPGEDPIADIRVAGDILRITTQGTDGSEIQSELKLVAAGGADFCLLAPPDVPTPKPWRLQRVETTP